MEALGGIAIVWFGIYVGAWLVFKVLPELLFVLLEMLCKLLGVLLRWLGVLLEWLWEWICELSPYVGEAIVWCAVRAGQGAFWCGKHSWHGLSAAAVFVYYVLDEAVREGKQPDQPDEDWEEAYEQEDDEEEFEEEEEDEDAYEKALQLLGLQTSCSLDEFRRAYKRAISRAHPDKGGTHEQALAVNTAREIIMSRNGWTR